MSNLDLRDREMAMTAELVRKRLQELGCGDAFGYSETDVWLEAGSFKHSLYRWRGWYHPGLETREDRATDVVRLLLEGDVEPRY